MDKENIIKELTFKAIRSSGSGGQHVNKVSSKIELSFNLQNSLSLTDEEKELLISKLSSKLTKEKVLILFCDESRSQHRNKEICINRFLELISKNLIRPKERKATKPSKASVRRKAENKRIHALKKAMRKKPNLDS